MDLLLFRKVPPDVPVTSPDVGRFSKILSVRLRLGNEAMESG